MADIFVFVVFTYVLSNIYRFLMRYQRYSDFIAHSCLP